MPLYSDSNYYYSGGSSQLYSPYYSPGMYSTPTSSTSSGSYAPYTSTYNRAMGGSYAVPLTPPRTPTYTTSSHGLSSRYQPKLSTITETLPLMGTPRHSSLMPLTRIQSPKFSTYTAPSTSTTTPYIPKYIAPRPILINTADLDVSSNSRFRKHHEEEAEAAKKAEAEKASSTSPSSSLKRPAETNTVVSDLSSNEQSEQPPERKGARSTIKRNRAVVRLSTIRSRSKDRSAKSSPAERSKQEPASSRFRDLPQLNDMPEVKLSWRQKLADDLAAIPTYPLKKSPGDKIRERYLIQDEKAADSVTTIVTRPTRSNEQPIEEVIVEIDPLHHTIRRLSIPQCPTFHEICEDISSDKIDDDLNAGELRRRASLIQEQEQELYNQLQKSPSGTYQLIHLERQGSHDSLHDETSRKSMTKRKSKRGSKKIRHKITAIVGVENAALTPVILETEECPTPRLSPKPKFTANVEAVEEHHEIHKIFKLPKKKSIKRTAKSTKDVVLPEGFVQSVPKSKSSPTTKPIAKQEKFISTAEIFTFDQMKEREGEKAGELAEDKETAAKLVKVDQSMVTDELSNAMPVAEKILDTLVKKPVTNTEIPTAILQPEILWDSPKTPKSPKATITIVKDKSVDSPKLPKKIISKDKEQSVESPKLPKKIIASEKEQRLESPKLPKKIISSEKEQRLESPKLPKKIIASEKEPRPESPKTPKLAVSLKDNKVPQSPTLLKTATDKIVLENSKFIAPTDIKDKTKTPTTSNLKSSISIDITSTANTASHPLEKSQSLNIDVGALAKSGAVIKDVKLSQEDVSKLATAKTMPKPLIQSEPNISASYQKPLAQTSTEVQAGTVTSPSISSSKYSSESGEDFWLQFGSSENLNARPAVTQDMPKPIQTTAFIGSSKPSSESGEDLWSHFSSSENLDLKSVTTKTKLRLKEDKPVKAIAFNDSSKASSESGEDLWSHLSSSEDLNAKPDTSKDAKTKTKDAKPIQIKASIGSSKPSSESEEDFWSHVSSSENLGLKTAKDDKPKPKEEKLVKTITSISSSKPSSESGEDPWSHFGSSDNLDKTSGFIKDKVKLKAEKPMQIQASIASSKPSSESGEDFWSHVGSSENLDAKSTASKDAKLKQKEENLMKTTTSIASSKPSSESGEDFWSHFGKLDTKPGATKDKLKLKEDKPMQVQTSIGSSKPSSESGEDFWSHLSSSENVDAKPATIKDAKPKPKDDKLIPTKTTKPTAAKTATPTEANTASKAATPAKQLEKSLTTEEAQPSVATPKPIRKFVQRSDSGEDFWSQIGSRETLYMTNRKKILLDEQLKKHEEEHLETQMKETQNVSETAIQKAKSAPKIDVKSEFKGAKLSNESTQADKLKIEPKKSDEVKNKAAKKTDPISQKKNKSSPTKLSPKKDLAKLQTAIKAKELKPETTPPLAKSTTTTTTTTAVPMTTTAATLPKINTGQAAKSPEQQQNKFATTAPETVTTTTSAATTTTTTITTAEKKAPTATAKLAINDASQMLINNTTAKKITKTVAVGEKTNDTASNETVPTATTTIKTQTEIKSSKIAETIKKPSPKKTVTPTNIGGKVKTSPTTKTSPSNVVATAINADNFISLATPKVASPTSNKTKTAAANASSTAKNAATTQQQQQHKPAMPTTNTIASTPAAKTTAAITTTTATVPAPTKTITTTTSIATDAKTIQTTTTTATTAVAQPAKYPDSGNDDDNDTRSGNNLSKFATVSNLAQCLQDVDADLEDYIPSSAENSDDDDDNSSSNYSSIDGRDNLSASMKKKLKQRRKKEKAAEKARFDPQKKIKIETGNRCYVSDEPPRFPLVATPRPLWKREKIVYPPESEDESGDSDEEDGSAEETDDSEECSTTSEEFDDETATPAGTTATSDSKDTNSAIIRMSTCSNDSGFEGGTAPSSPKKMLECDVNCHKKCERLTANMCGVNQKLIVEALASVRRGAQEARESPSTPPSTNPAYRIEAHEEHDETSYTYSQFQKSGRFTAPATVIPRFKTYSVDDFHFLAVLGKGSFGKVLLAELRNTEYYYAVKCLKKDVVLEDDDVDSTLIERKVLALGTKHPYLCHLFCTFQTESHLFFVMEYLNGGDLMFHIQESGRFPEDRARFYGAEIISGLKFLHKKGIIYRDLKLDNVLLDFDGHVRIADFGMCKLQIYLDKTADSFCGTPDYMAPEIIKGEKYNQNVDWWSFGVLLYEMLIGQSPFSGCDEDELFWSICNEIPWFPVYISAEATSILKGLLEKDYVKRIGSQYSLAGDIAEHIFFSSIDWNLLDKRQLEPPFKPQVKHPLDTQYFDRVFTRERVRLTPIDKDILHSMDQKQFHGFSYTNPHITLD